MARTRRMLGREWEPYLRSTCLDDAKAPTETQPFASPAGNHHVETAWCSRYTTDILRGSIDLGIVVVLALFPSLLVNVVLFQRRVNYALELCTSAPDTPRPPFTGLLPHPDMRM